MIIDKGLMINVQRQDINVPLLAIHKYRSALFIVIWGLWGKYRKIIIYKNKRALRERERERLSLSLQKLCIVTWHKRVATRLVVGSLQLFFISTRSADVLNILLELDFTVRTRVISRIRDFKSCTRIYRLIDPVLLGTDTWRYDTLLGVVLYSK